MIKCNWSDTKVNKEELPICVSKGYLVSKKWRYKIFARLYDKDTTWSYSFGDRTMIPTAVDTIYKKIN
jgi:hypothetical protein